MEKKRIRKKIYRPGVYAVFNPLGEVYVGQTMNLDRRRREYMRYAKGKEKRVPSIGHSLIKYGFDSHEFKVLAEFPKDVSRTVLKTHENFIYWQYKEGGIKLINEKEGGTDKVMSDRVKKRQSDLLKKRWENAEYKERQRANKTGRKIHSEEEKQKRAKWMKENRKKWENYIFTPEDTIKGQAAIKKIIQERGYLVSPEAMEKGRQKKSKIILNTDTGIFYYGCREAAETMGVHEDTIRAKLKGKNRNNTSFVYV